MPGDHFSSEDSVFSIEEEYQMGYQRKKSTCKGFNLIIFCILIFELCERLTYYSLTANLIPFCEKYLEMSSVNAMNFSLIYTGCIYFLCIFCGWISDSYLGKFRTIWMSGMIYFVGIALITTVTFDFSTLGNYGLTSMEKKVFSGFGFIMIAIGTGGIKTTVGPMGAEQFEEKDENLIKLFFVWLYWFVNLGGAVGFAIVTYVQQNIDFFYGFLIPLGSMLLALFIFLMPQKFYKNKYKIKSNQIALVVNIVWESMRKKSKSIYKYRNLTDYARLSNGGSFEENTINDVLKLKQIIPVMLTLIPFFMSYVQMQSSFFVQGEHLNLNISSFTIPVASLNIVDTAVIILFTPVLAIIIYPLILKCFGKSPTPLQRMGFGLFLSALSVLMAGILEIIRKTDIRNNGTIEQTIFKKAYSVSKISVLTQIPQFFFIAAGEVFTSASGLEFAYSQAPATQQSIITGIFYAMMGLGSFCSVFLNWLVNLNPKNEWMGDDIDSSHYEYFYFLLTGIILLDVVVFYFIARVYRYVATEENKPLIVKYQKKALSDDVIITS